MCIGIFFENFWLFQSTCVQSWTFPSSDCFTKANILNMKQGKRNNERHLVLLNVTHIWPKTNYSNLTNGITIFKKKIFSKQIIWKLWKFHSNHFHGRIKFNNFNEWTKYTTTNNGLTISTISLVKRKFLLFSTETTNKSASHSAKR